MPPSPPPAAATDTQAAAPASAASALALFSEPPARQTNPRCRRYPQQSAARPDPRAVPPQSPRKRHSSNHSTAESQHPHAAHRSPTVPELVEGPPRSSSCLRAFVPSCLPLHMSDEVPSSSPAPEELS